MRKLTTIRRRVFRLGDINPEDVNLESFNCKPVYDHTPSRVWIGEDKKLCAVAMEPPEAQGKHIGTSANARIAEFSRHEGKCIVVDVAKER